MAKSSTRRINIYINGKEVEATVKGIRSEMNKLINEQNRMTIGSDEYIAHAKKIQQLRGYLQEHSHNIDSVAGTWEKLQRKMMVFLFLLTKQKLLLLPRQRLIPTFRNLIQDPVRLLFFLLLLIIILLIAKRTFILVI